MMVKTLRLVACLCLCTTLFSQASNQTTPAAQPDSSDSTKADQAQTPPPPTPPAAPKGFVLEDGTPVKLRTNRTVSSGDSQVGDTLDFEVLEDVQVKGVVVIPKGGLAFATVTEAQAKRRMARGGKLDINIDYAKLVDSEKAPLRAVKAVQGGGHTAAMTGGIVATSLVFFPAAPFFLFMHGKDISISKGTAITAYVNGDMKLDITKFQAVSPPPATPAAASGSAPTPAPSSSTPAPESGGSPPAAAPANSASASGDQAHLQVSSTPEEADIEIDGSFVGNTPSTIGVSAGQHKITVKKSGFTPWERTITISSGQVSVNAVLEQSK
jgi:hypothetical protein